MSTQKMELFRGLSPIVLMAVLAFPSVLEAQSGGVSLSLGTEGPTAELEDLEGNAVSLLDYVEAGKPAVLEFWATWC